MPDLQGLSTLERMLQAQPTVENGAALGDPVVVTNC